MKRFTDAIESSVQTQNWYAAIALTLTMPDICGALETPEAGNGVRYKRWFAAWMEPNYTTVLPKIGRHVFLSAENCWGLRCSYLHAGNGEIRPGKVKQVLESFHFIEPPPGNNTIHLNQVGRALQLQTDIFCREMIAAVLAWQDTVKDDADIESRRQDLLQIHNFVPGINY